MKNTLLIVAASLFVTALLTGSNAMSAEPGRVSDLAWMTGSWKGPMGEQTLEENWTRPAAGTITSVIRITDGDQTNLVELILIEEEGDSLVFRVRQWLPGYVPRSAEPQTMLLTEIGERRARFEAPDPGELRSLTYSRPSTDSFNIDVETKEGVKFQINLKAQ
jgi:hypothetical protein